MNKISHQIIKQIITKERILPNTKSQHNRGNVLMGSIKYDYDAFNSIIVVAPSKKQNTKIAKREAKQLEKTSCFIINTL